MPNNVKLPEPPEFPLSNASYNKIVDKMHKAALNATTCEAAIAAVSMCKAAVQGINTYSKKSRRYADELLVALGMPAEAAPAVAQGVVQGAAKAKGKAPFYAEWEAKAEAAIGGKRRGPFLTNMQHLSNAAASDKGAEAAYLRLNALAETKGMKPANFMAETIVVETAGGPVKVDPAKLAVDPSLAPGGANAKAYSNKSNAKRALKQAQLDHLPVEWAPGADGGFQPILLVSDKAGVTYAAERGFFAKVSA